MLVALILLLREITKLQKLKEITYSYQIQFDVMRLCNLLVLLTLEK